jgi:hypothetical protein
MACHWPGAVPAPARRQAEASWSQASGSPSRSPHVAEHRSRGVEVARVGMCACFGAPAARACSSRCILFCLPRPTLICLPPPKFAQFWPWRAAPVQRLRFCLFCAATRPSPIRAHPCTVPASQFSGFFIFSPSHIPLPLLPTTFPPDVQQQRQGRNAARSSDGTVASAENQTRLSRVETKGPRCLTRQPSPDRPHLLSQRPRPHEHDTTRPDD